MPWELMAPAASKYKSDFAKKVVFYRKNKLKKLDENYPKNERAKI